MAAGKTIGGGVPAGVYGFGAEAIVVRDSEYVEISGFRLRGTALRMEDVRRCKLDDIHIEYGSAVANPFGENLAHPSVTSARWNAVRKTFDCRNPTKTWFSVHATPP